MNKRTAVAVICGVLAAGILCAITGIVVYFTANGKAISLLIGLFTIFTGSIITGIAAIVLITILIMWLINKRKNNKQEENGEDYDR